MKYDASSEARNTYEVAISSGSPARPIGTCDPNFSVFSSGKEDGMSGVQTGPGATAANTKTSQNLSKFDKAYMITFYRLSNILNCKAPD